MKLQIPLVQLILLVFQIATTFAHAQASISSAASSATTQIEAGQSSRTATHKQGMNFVTTRVAITATAPYSVDLNTVFLKADSQQYPVLAISMTCGSSETDEPVFTPLRYAEVRGVTVEVGSIYKLSAGLELSTVKDGPATLSVAHPPATVCLLFAAPSGLRLTSSVLVGIIADPIKVPAAAK